MTDGAKCYEMVVLFLFNELVDGEDFQVVGEEVRFLGQFSLTTAHNRLERIDLPAWQRPYASALILTESHRYFPSSLGYYSYPEFRRCADNSLSFNL